MILGCAVFLAVSVTGPVRAGEYRAFSEAMAEAATGMRGAIFYLRTRNTMMAGFELDGLAVAWTALVKRYAGKPPDVYAEDPKWRATLDGVSENLAKARAAAAKGDVATAKGAVKAMRQALADLRQHNGVYVFEDCVAEMREAFGRLFIYRRKPPDFNSPEQVGKVKAATAIAEYVFRRCHGSAPAAYRDDEMFQRLFAQSFKEFELLAPAIARRDTRQFVDLLRQIVSHLHLMFLRFG
jgi:hypothetical protein